MDLPSQTSEITRSKKEMALLNVSLCTKIPPKPHLSLTKPSLSIPHLPSLSFSHCDKPQALIPNKQLVEDFAKTGFLAILSVSLFFTDPALAFKGGGPYGSEVTRGQDLTGKDFSGRTLIKQDFKTSILRQANFKGAKLLGASFFDADLTGADLSDADLRSADFSLANVTKANLSNANLEGALATGNTSFRGSNITGADFTDVPLREDQREYLCKFADGVNPTTGNATRDTLLCN
ncbi:PREDICTED: thylakoid lumenal 15 kDa protein 1, chloroplastic-like isoform X2 [Populus euphratica]|uniref:Thylakoid lumenal 15 kDa protein 1, chloroplastic-like isoform X2 n=1 Tax=Populus euphratica TaxID=75702 RepID=A0AAJ6UPZ5_POPEU|nr:PREDICTED: thylakoid lumenal 15 kDa protein 1, chloroplastic-like isoform X2 [Populus euphratica]